VVELRVFGGVTAEETARLLGVSKRTVDSDWSVARLWLARALRPAAHAAGERPRT
jgi:DNA-directed RNA polymerase specialized sigma24 family protein